jgi:hypothetical protein
LKVSPEIDFVEFFNIAAQTASSETESSKVQANKFAQMMGRRWTVAHATGNVALFTIGLAFLALLVFAMKNIALL